MSKFLCWNNDEVDYTDVEMDIIYRKHQIFTSEFEETDIYYGNIEFFKKGKNIWNN